MAEIESLQEIWRITERRGDAVYKTHFTGENRWVTAEEMSDARRSDPDILFTPVSDPTITTIRCRKGSAD